MGHRLSKITSRTGDAGDTGFDDGSRVAKRALRIHALRGIDELHSALGLTIAQSVLLRADRVIEWLIVAALCRERVTAAVPNNGRSQVFLAMFCAAAQQARSNRSLFASSPLSSYASMRSWCRLTCRAS